MDFKVLNREENELLNLIYQRYYKLMLFVAQKHLFDSTYAEDVVHESILRIISCLDHLDTTNEDSVKCFICVITKNIAIDYNRHNGVVLRVEAMEESYEPEWEDPADTVIGADLYRRLRAGIAHLDAKYRDVCYLKYICELKEREIANALSITVNTVGTRLRRAKAILRKMFEQDDDN